MKTDDEWKRLLTPMQYAVLRQGHTEPCVHRRVNGTNVDGTYVCAGRGAEPFTCGRSTPAAEGRRTRAIAEGATEHADTSRGMVRTEDVRPVWRSSSPPFDDGPGPTGARYCINSASVSLKKPSQT
jgi:peptide-methionine (R)-S-oxide reductase